MKEWQRGYEIELLQSLAAPFIRAFKPHTYGAFGIPKERDIASALEKNQLAYVKANDGSVAATAIVKRLKARGEQTDFARRKIKTKRGDIQIKAIAGNVDGVQRILASCIQRSNGSPIWVEVHEEEPIAASLVREIGAARVATKISASSDIKSLYLIDDLGDYRVSGPLLQSDEPGLVLLKAEFLSQAELDKVKAEIAEASPEWADHYSSYNKRHTWTAVAIKGFDRSDPSFIIKPAEMSKGWKAENPERLKAPCELTSIAPLFPHTLDFLQRIPGEKERIRFMRLGDGHGHGELTRHADITDREAGTANGQISRLHIPIETNPECYFRSWDLEGCEHRRNFPPGCLFYLDIRKPHAVINAGTSDRVHLVIDVRSGPELREWILEGR